MTAADRLNEIEARHIAWHDSFPNVAEWSDLHGALLTIETVEAALYRHVYRLWEARGMFCPEPDAHETVSEFARPMLRALPNAAIDRRTEAGL